MLTIEKSCCIRSSCEGSDTTAITIRKENGVYNFHITNNYGDKIELMLGETMTSELFTALKELGNFM